MSRALLVNGVSKLLPVMNNTKWKEIQEAMYGLQQKPQWRTRCVTNGYISNWDGEWFYHFSEGGFKDIEWVEIKVENNEQFELVSSSLKSIHVPGEKIENGFKVYGYIRDGESVEYL